MERVWVWGTGGPHLLMEKRYIDLWEADADTDEQALYYKTGEVDGKYIIKMTLGDGCCIVISEEGPSTWISNENGNGGILVVSIYEEKEFNEEEFIEKVRRIPNDEYVETGIEYKVYDDELYLFPACDLKPGYSESYNKVYLIPGTYKVKIIENYELTNGRFIIFKFVKL